MAIDDSQFSGVFDLEVTYRKGPKQGQVERHKLQFLEGGRVLLLIPTFPGAGRWEIDGDNLSFDVHEVVLDKEGLPSVVINISAHVELEPDRNAFAGNATGKVYGADAGIGLITTQHVEQRAWRHDAGEPSDTVAEAGVPQS